MVILSKENHGLLLDGRIILSRLPPIFPSFFQANVVHSQEVKGIVLVEAFKGITFQGISLLGFSINGVVANTIRSRAIHRKAVTVFSRLCSRPRTVVHVLRPFVNLLDVLFLHLVDNLDFELVTRAIFTMVIRPTVMVFLSNVLNSFFSEGHEGKEKEGD